MLLLCCGQTAVGRSCGMACCQKQAPPRRRSRVAQTRRSGPEPAGDHAAFRRPACSATMRGMARPSPPSFLSCNLGWRPPTLRSEHVCMASLMVAGAAAARRFLETIVPLCDFPHYSVVRFDAPYSSRFPEVCYV